jgi:hypothetical protein
MKHYNANVIVYVKQAGDQEHADRISQAINGLHGVVHAEASNWAKSFFSVDYDPFTTDSRFILKSVTDQGYNAVLVGM